MTSGCRSSGASSSASSPEGLPPTELLPEDDRTLWVLHLGAKDKGVDYAAIFELPVYVRRAESRDSAG